MRTAILVLCFFLVLAARASAAVDITAVRGIDCTGKADSTAAYQAAVDGMPDAGTLFHPVGCKLLLGTGVVSGQCGIRVTGRVGVQFVSEVRIGNYGGGQTPQLIWNGKGGTVFCVNSTDHPRFVGLAFQVSRTGNMDSCIVFDGNPVGHIGSNGEVDYVTCNNGENNNLNFIGISISPTATNNHENYELSHVYFNCSGSRASVRARDGVTTAGSPTISSATAAFSRSDVGQPINVSYPAPAQNALANFQTTVLSVPDPRHAVLAVPIPASVTGATIITGQSHGIGIRSGPSQNAVQQSFKRITYNNCHVGIALVGGNADMEHIGGGFSDVGISIATWVAEQVSISYYEAENDLRGIDSTGPLLQVTNARLSNGNQYGDGFLRFGAVVNIQNSFGEFEPPSGAVLIGANPTNNPTITSISNIWRASWGQLGYSLISMPPPTVINDAIAGGAPAQFMFGCWNQNGAAVTNPASCMRISNVVGHGGGAALQVVSGNQYSDKSTAVIGIRVTDDLWIVGSYEAISSTGNGNGRISGENTALHLQQVPTRDPKVMGAIWNNNGVLTRSGE